MAKKKVAERSSTFPFMHTPVYTRSTPANGETFENTFNEYDSIINFLYTSLKEEIERESTPIGSYLMGSMGITDPRYVLCDGRELNRSEFPILNEGFALANYPYGAGDGSTTFNIPNLVEEELFMRSCQADLSNLGQTQEDAMQKIEGEISVGEGTGAVATSSVFSGVFTASGDYELSPQPYSSLRGKNIKIDSSLVTRTAEETRPKNMAVAVYIKVK